MLELFRFLTSSVWHDFRRAWGALVVFEALLKLLEAWLVVPAVAVVLSIVLSRGNHVAVSNLDILDFLLSPLGLVYAALFGTVAVVLLLIEQAGIMAIVALAEGGGRPPVIDIARLVVLKTSRVAQLGAVKVILLALTSVPFVVLTYLTYVVFLSRHDINYYVEARPPAFWFAAVVGAIVLLAALATGTWLYVRWSFALPIVLFEGRRGQAALRDSGDRTRGAAWEIGSILIVWHLGILVSGIALQAGLRLIATAVLDHFAGRQIGVILILLAVQGALLAVLSFVAAVGQGLITRRLYLVRSEHLGIFHSQQGPEGPQGTTWHPAAWTRGAVGLSAALVVLAPMAVWSELTRRLADRADVRVTAHRGHSLAAPENTLSAIAKAIDAGADYAEIDVQQTADGVVVLVHDSDLKRVAGVARKCGELSYDEIKKLDVGSWFDPSFAGERVPSLVDVFDLARGKIKLNIELKVDRSDRRLAAAVAALVREHGFESDCLITSFSYDALLEAKRIDPGLRAGLIIALALGDVSRLKLEALSVRAESLTDEMIAAAHRAGQEVHVWTVNNPRQMDRLIKRGVDNIITDQPDVLIRVRDEWARLTWSERLLLAARLILGIDG
jgi:glycerophosphoryl diester phosphodiesterase